MVWLNTQRHRPYMRRCIINICMRSYNNSWYFRNLSETLSRNSRPDIPGILISVIIKSGCFELSSSNASDALAKDSTSKRSSSALTQIVLMLSSSSIIRLYSFYFTLIGRTIVNVVSLCLLEHSIRPEFCIIID